MKFNYFLILIYNKTNLNENRILIKSIIMNDFENFIKNKKSDLNHNEFSFEKNRNFIFSLFIIIQI